QVERARLARDDVAAAPAPEDERAEAPRVPRRVQRLADREDQRERADQPGERFADLLVRGRVARTRDQVDDDLRVERRLEERALPDQDRKSTRLNSSHVKISYAVFCLK